jgi:hypothetical protein
MVVVGSTLAVVMACGGGEPQYVVVHGGDGARSHDGRDGDDDLACERRPVLCDGLLLPCDVPGSPCPERKAILINILSLSEGEHSLPWGLPR